VFDYGCSVQRYRDLDGGYFSQGVRGAPTSARVPSWEDPLGLARDVCRPQAADRRELRTAPSEFRGESRPDKRRSEVYLTWQRLCAVLDGQRGRAVVARPKSPERPCNGHRKFEIQNQLIR